MAIKRTVGTDYKTKSGYKTSSKTTSWKGGKLITEKYATRRENFGGDDYRNFTILQSTSSINVLNIVFIVLLCAAVMGAMSSGRVPTFQGFLEFLTTVPVIDFSVVTNGITDILAGISEGWLRSILSVVAGPIQLLVFCTGGLLQALTFILWFLGWLVL